MENVSINPEIELDPFFAADLRQMQKANNYRQWQVDLISPHIHGGVLEIGGGIGTFTGELARRASSVVSLEPNAYCFTQLKTSVQRHPNVRALDVPVESLAGAVSESWRADVVVCMNVLEHIRDDASALRSFHSHLKPGGRVIITVPAGSWAYGEIDRRLGHYRRYDKASLRAVFQQAGLRVDRLHYFNSVGIWAWWWNAKFGHSKEQSDFQIQCFDRGVVPWLSKLERLIHPPLGQSLLAVGCKP